jgi:hypothetical protein
MSDFEWRSPETYVKSQTAEAADFAGEEHGRRDSRCREEYRTARNSEAIAVMYGIARERRDSFTVSVNDVPATRDIFCFPVESVAIRHAVVAETPGSVDIANGCVCLEA